MVPLMYNYDDNHRLPSLEEHMKSANWQCCYTTKWTDYYLTCINLLVLRGGKSEDPSKLVTISTATYLGGSELYLLYIYGVIIINMGDDKASHRKVILIDMYFPFYYCTKSPISDCARFYFTKSLISNCSSNYKNHFALL